MGFYQRWIVPRLIALAMRNYSNPRTTFKAPLAVEGVLLGRARHHPPGL
jgi:hypothetical protein